jgi:hypothetical protein
VYPDITLKRAREGMAKTFVKRQQRLDKLAFPKIGLLPYRKNHSARIPGDAQGRGGARGATHHAAIIEPERIGELLRAIDTYGGRQ